MMDLSTEGNLTLVQKMFVLVFFFFNEFTVSDLLFELCVQMT